MFEEWRFRDDSIVLSSWLLLLVQLNFVLQEDHQYEEGQFVWKELVSETLEFAAPKKYLKAEWIVSCMLLPFSFSSLLIRVIAAEIPIKTAKIGSATLEMRYVGGILRMRSKRERDCVIESYVEV